MLLLQKILTLAVLLPALYSCNNQNKRSAENVHSPEAATVVGNFKVETPIKFDSTILPVFLQRFPAFVALGPDLNQFYTQRNFSYAWYDSAGIIEPAGNLYNLIKNVDLEGIPVSRLPYQKELTDMMELVVSASRVDSSRPFTELMLTAQYLTYAREVWVGLRENQSLSLEWLLPRKRISYSETLDSLLAGKDVLTNPPVYRQYYLLKEHLRRYRLAEKADSIKVISTKTLKQQDSSLAVRHLRGKLYLYGDISQDNHSMLFDDEVTTGVKRFQRRVGLKVTGKVAKHDMDELNVSIHQRIEQILVNMERSRWVSDDIKGDYLIVNIPEFKLHAVSDDSTVWSMNVVVGKNQHKTVVFNGKIQYIVFSPYWNIPAGIMKNEILPAIKRNPSYLSKNNMEWNGTSIRQKPGKNNALGRVKFMFPNTHSIYLHDTPARSLFAETNRAFSHGCIRVAEPEKLASYLLAGDSNWSVKEILLAMKAGRERTVALKEPVPVFIAYFTAWVSQTGDLNFRKDIYGRDTTLLSMILN